jgi:hypothetical protein
MDLEPLRFQLELAVDSEPIEGLLHREQGESVPFTGWLELMAAIDATRTQALDATPRAVRDEDASILPRLKVRRG